MLKVIYLVTILVIEDTMQDRDGLEKILLSAGHEIYTADDGQDGLAVFREIKPRIVLVDIIMPDINGIEVLKEIKKESPETKVILCTGAGSGSMVDLAMRLGADGYIVKPYDADRILMGIQRALGI